MASPSTQHVPTSKDFTDLVKEVQRISGENARISGENVVLRQSQVAAAALVPPPVAPVAPTPSRFPTVLQQALRTTKVSKFNGARDKDARMWLFAVNRSFKAYPDAVDDDKISLAVEMLEGPAMEWWRYQETVADEGESNLPSTWQEFSDAFISKYEPVNAKQRYRDQLASLRQTGSVSAYATAMCNLFQRMPGMDAETKLDTFERSLKTDVQRELRIRMPQTLTEAITMAENYDTVTYRRDASRSSAPTARYGGPQPMELGALRDERDEEECGYDEGGDDDGQRDDDGDDEAYSDLIARMNAIEVRRNGPRPLLRQASTSAPPPPKMIGAPLTSEQKSWARAKGLCWNCYQSGHGASTCPHIRSPAKDRAPRS